MPRARGSVTFASLAAAVDAVVRIATRLRRWNATAADAGDDVPSLFRARRSDVVVVARGRIVRLLADDLDTSDGTGQHQRFLVELSDRDRTTVRIAHNLAFGRVPARVGAAVAFRGEYEWTPRGGTVHWTHHDPQGIHPDGWIELDGRRYG